MSCFQGRAEKWGRFYFPLPRDISLFSQRGAREKIETSRTKNRNVPFFLRTAQSPIEYAILIAILSAAVVAMSPYVRRAMRAKLKTVELALNMVEKDFDTAPITTLTSTPVEPLPSPATDVYDDPVLVQDDVYEAPLGAGIYYLPLDQCNVGCPALVGIDCGGNPNAQNDCALDQTGPCSDFLSCGSHNAAGCYVLANVRNVTCHGMPRADDNCDGNLTGWYLCPDGVDNPACIDINTTTSQYRVVDCN